MVSALDSRLRGPGLSPVQEHCFVFLGQTLARCPPSFINGQVANLMLSLVTRWTSIPSRGA